MQPAQIQVQVAIPAKIFIRHLEIGSHESRQQITIVLLTAKRLTGWLMQRGYQLQAARGHLDGRRHAAFCPPAAAARVSHGINIGQQGRTGPLCAQIT